MGGREDQQDDADHGGGGGNGTTAMTAMTARNNGDANSVVSLWMEAQERIKSLVQDGRSLVDDKEYDIVRQEFLGKSLDAILGTLFHLSDEAFHAVDRPDAHADGVVERVKFMAMVERGLWKYGFYTVIHAYRSLLKAEKSAEVMDTFVVFLDGAISWYSYVLTEIQGQYDAQSSRKLNVEYMRMMRSRCYVCIGDLHRYKLQYCRSENDDTVEPEKESRDAYIDAISQWAFMGSPFNQIAVLYGIVPDHFRSLFYYVRAATAREPFGSAEENMAILLQKAISSGDIVSENRQKKGDLKKKKKKKGANVIETTTVHNGCSKMTEQRWVKVFSMLFFQIDVDNIPHVWQDGYGDLEEYLNRRLQKARKLASRSKPTFGKSRQFTNDALYLHHSRVFQDFKDDSTLMMMVQMLLLLMQGKLEHAKCTNLRLKLTRAQGYMVVLNLAGRLASLVGRCQTIFKKHQEQPHAMDAISSEFSLPLVLLLSWISKDWTIHKDASLLMCRQACEDYPKNEPFFEKTLCKFFGGLASMARAVMPHGRHVFRDKGKLSRLSHIGIIHGCTLLEVIADYPLFVSKKMRERQGIVEQRRVPRRQRDKAFGMHIASWTLIHHIWTMLGEISSQVNDSDVSLGLDDSFSGLRKSIDGLVVKVMTDVEDEDDAMDADILDNNTNDTSMHDQEEDIVYVARKRKEKKRDTSIEHNMTLKEQSERMIMTSSMGIEEDVGHAFDENYNTYRLAHEMAADVLFDDGFEIGPSQIDQYHHEDATGINIGTIPTKYHDR